MSGASTLKRMGSLGARARRRMVAAIRTRFAGTATARRTAIARVDRLAKERKNGNRIRKMTIFNVSILFPLVHGALPLAFPGPEEGGHGLLGDLPFFFGPYRQDFYQTPIALDF